jgi:pyruvate formate lyase activating enzyme
MDNFPLIVDIKRHSLEDGPGIRTVVFFKGCPLRCIFCHNPETQEPEKEIAFFPGQCIHCGNCADTCPQGAIDFTRAGRIDRERCIRCGNCARACPGRGMRLIGAPYSIETLSEILLRDLPFYHHSGGGVTLSGGECTLYPDYLEPLLRRMKKRGIHLTLETSGHFDYQIFSKRILPYLDLIYYDLKIIHPEIHIRYTGRPNQTILDNLERLLTIPGVDIHPRVPLIPRVTATAENLSKIIDHLCRVGAKDVSLLPYNPAGIEMAVRLGKPKPLLPDGFMTRQEEREILLLFNKLLEEKKKKGSPPHDTRRAVLDRGELCGGPRGSSGCSGRGAISENPPTQPRRV